MNGYRPKCGGYSLVELMIAMVIAAIMFTGIYMVSLQSMNMLQLTRDESRATQALQYQLEKLRSQTWMSLLTMDDDTTFSSDDNAALGYLKDGQGSVKRTVITPANITDAPILAVTVTVSWKNYDGEAASKSLTTSITKRGMLK